MKGFGTVLREFWNGSTILEIKNPEARIVANNYTKEQPQSVTFEKLIKYHDYTPQIQIAVSSYSELISGTDIVINTDDVHAKDFIDEWIRKTDFYTKFESVVTTLLVTGNALLEKLDEKNIEDVSEVDMATVISKKRDQYGKLEYYEQRLQNGGTGKLGEGHLGKFIEFNLTHYSKQAWGRSLFYSLAVPRTTGYRTTAPLVEIMWGMEDAMAGIIQNNAFPITTITYAGANDEYLKAEAERWRKYKPGDKRVQKIKPEIEFFETNPASKYTDYINHIEKVFELGTQFPHDIMTGDFTSRASSETTETIVLKKVRGFQRYLSNKIKAELFDPLLDQNGFNSQKVNLSVSFVAQNVLELTPEQVSKLFTDKAITINELREWYRDNTGIDLPDDALIKTELDIAKQKEEEQHQSQMDMNAKVSNLKNKIESLTTDKAHDDKIRQLAEQMDEKMNLINQAIIKDKEELASKRIKALERFIEKVEKLG